MKVASKHAGKKVACPKCHSQLLVPGGPAPAVAVVTPVPAAPVQSVPVQAVFQPPPQPAPQPLPDFFSTPAGASPGGLQPYTPPAAASRAPKRKSTSTQKIGMLVALIGVCIICGGLAFSGFGQATLHLLVFRPTFSAGGTAEDFKRRVETTKTLSTMSEVTIKTGRTVLAIGTLTAVVGYGICIASSGAQMGLAIAALIAGATMFVLDLSMRVVPYLAENDMPQDFVMMRTAFGPLGRSKAYALIAPSLEILMALHLLLFAIFAVVGFKRIKKANAAIPATSIVLFGVYIVLVLIVSIILISKSGPGSKSLLYTLIAMQWIANLCLGVGLGFLIASIAKLRSG